MCAYQQPVDQGRTNSIKNKSGAIRTDKTVWSHGCSSFISEAVPASFEVQAWDCCDAPPIAPTILVAVVAVVAVVAWKRNIYAVDSSICADITTQEYSNWYTTILFRT